ncbi:MAG TPA: hypothetical protein DHV12_06920 [Thermotogae bacterium]|nr:hypothetical protein [Thermotogota bacterium]
MNKWILPLFLGTIFITTLLANDMDNDGFPDVVEYWNEAEIFREWVRTIGYTIALQPERFEETITDCAALVRFTFVEALKKHDLGWFERFNPLVTFSEKDLSRCYPDINIIGVNVFRTGEDSFHTFADSLHLLQYNLFFVSRNLKDALPGDVLVYFHPAGHTMPYHTMVYLGEYIDGESYVIYHTGPSENDKGSIKVVKADTLLYRAPQQWRASELNPYFLGIFRWSMIYFNPPVSER